MQLGPELQALGGGGNQKGNRRRTGCESLSRVWPGGWPGQGLVDLDNVGDPGYWLSEKMEAEPISQTLFGWDWNDEATAAMLADDYLRMIRELGYPLPSDYDNEAESAGDGWTEEDEALVRAEFVAFIKHWRERILTTIEEQNPPSTGDDRRPAGDLPK